MKNIIEKEITHFTTNFNLNTKELIEELCNNIEEKQLNYIKYRDRFQLLVEDNEHDKTKITFKVNHGDVTYSIATKDRLTSTNDIIQSYQEIKTDWTPIEELDFSIFNNKILSFYYKETKKVTVKYENNKYKIIGHDVKFLDLNGEVRNQMKYIEVESKKFENDHVSFFSDFLKKRQLDLIDYDNSKLKVGQDILRDNNQLTFSDISQLKEFILDLYIKMSIYHIV
ncbi:hypothetical protein [Bacillus mycoides]|uniref:hypothetical protein n=1 Tax=Bacillus mycoides TaxID=1405 RepID=UPI002E20DEE9|nr:hypothetical protein [Bacillus mycoides]MED1024351.1 hypothetical protein [Bacillus mycoides]MED1054628.1 hypothetical protein [Bacillus mycoides]